MVVKSSRLLCLAVASQQLWLGVSSFSTSLETSSLASTTTSIPPSSRKEAAAASTLQNYNRSAAAAAVRNHVVFMTPTNNDNQDDSSTSNHPNTSSNSVMIPLEKEKVVVKKQQHQRALVGITGLVALTIVTLCAKLGLLLPGNDFTNADIILNIGSTLLTSVLGYGFVKICTTLVAHELLEPRDSRKIIHTLSAPLFCLFWPIFSSQAGARFFAAVVPFVNAMRLYVAANSSGVEGGEETELANAVSRSGNAKEALGGPFIYVLVLLFSVLLFWRDSLAGIVALSAMAAGDGMADLLGRRYGKNNKWPFAPNDNKSIAGSLAFFVFGTACAVGLAMWMQWAGCLTIEDFGRVDLVRRVAAIMAACATIELLPLGDDNWTVPISAAVLSLLFL